MLKFKVGDVLVVKEGKNYEPDEQEIEVLEVDEARPANAYRTSDQPDYWWCKSTVEDNYDLKKEKYMKLKKGDKIRITQRGSHEFNKGEVVVVDFTREHADQHVFANHQHKGAARGYLYECEYELIEQTLEDEKMSYTTDFLLGTYVQCTVADFEDIKEGEYYKINKYTKKSGWTPKPEYVASVEDIKPYNAKGSRHTHMLHKDCWKPVTKAEIIENRPDLAQYITPEPQIDGVEVFSIKHKFHTDYDIKHVGGGLFKDMKGNYWNLLEITPYETTMTANYEYIRSYDVILINHNGDNAFLTCDGYSQYMRGQYAQLVSLENLKLKYIEKNI